MSRPNPRPDLDFRPVRNGIDYLFSAVEHLTAGDDPPDDRDLKYAVLHMQAAAEVLLKARLVREHWALAFQDPGTADQDAFLTGKFKSCTLEAAIDRLIRIANVTITPKDRAAIKALSEDRNALTHYGHTANAYQIETRAARVLSFLLTFIHHHLYPQLTSEEDLELVEDRLSRLRERLSDINALVTNRMNDLSGELAPLADRTVQCPACTQWAVVVGEPSPECRFCLEWWGVPHGAAMHYGSTAVSEDFADLAPCPNCAKDLVVLGARVAHNKSTSIALCFGCAATPPLGDVA
ncbi:hypothetical protein R2F25_20565 [Streptomyces sp. UP1A-1]|nr:hypothetical protein [Streptomyces sp. UP1A-1]